MTSSLDEGTGDGHFADATRVKPDGTFSESRRRNRKSAQKPLMPWVKKQEQRRNRRRNGHYKPIEEIPHGAKKQGNPGP